MTSLHSDLVEDNLHRPFNYEQSADPGAVGAGKYWLDTDTFELWRRDGTDTGWDAIAGGGGGGPATQIDETGGPTTLDIAAIADGEYLRRSGTDIIGDTPSGGGVLTYQIDIPPASPSAQDDEFNAGSLDGKWTSFGSPGILSVTDLEGFVHITKTGSVAQAGIFEAFVPGANAFGVGTRMFGSVLGAASNQVLLTLADSGGAEIVSVGMLNGKDAIVKAAALTSGFDDFSFGNNNAGMGQVYFAILRDATTNYTVHMSKDGIIWAQLSSFSQAGTVARIYLSVIAQSATLVDSYFDWVRKLGTASLKFGNTP